MKPKKSKELIEQVGREIAMPARVIEDIVNFYWKDVWDNLTSLSAPKIHILNFGDFNIKHWLLDREISKCEGFQKGTRIKGIQKAAAGHSINHKLVLLQKIKQEVNEEKQRKEFIYEHKRLKNETIEDLEQSGSDLDRGEELSLPNS